MNQRRSFKEALADLGIPAVLLKLLGVTVLISVFGFRAIAESLWMDNWFWVPLAYTCAAVAWTSLVVLLGFMLVKEHRDLRKTRGPIQ